MDVFERLTEAELAKPDYLAASHLHRYALAARLCAGLRVLDVGCGTGYGTALLARTAASAHGVDLDADAVAEAERTHTGPTFATGDALAVLRETAEVDAIVMFEALEHVPEPDAVLAELRRLRTAGVRLIVSVPNSRAFHERNPFHLTDYGWAEARRAFAGIEGATLLYQHLAEGSLILTEDGEPALDAEVAALDQAEPEYANSFLCVAGFEDVEAASARLNLVATPSHNRYMLELERANAEVFRTNRQLAKQLMGKHDAAAALMASRFEREIEHRDGLVAAVDHEKVELQRELRRLREELHQERAWRDAPRYHMVDRVTRALGAIPIVSLLARGAWAVARRAFRRRPSG